MRRSQKERIMKYLQSGRKLTGLYATNIMHIMDYRKRISELRAEGYEIADEWAKDKKKHITYKRYYLCGRH